MNNLRFLRLRSEWPCRGRRFPTTRYLSSAICNLPSELPQPHRQNFVLPPPLTQGRLGLVQIMFPLHRGGLGGAKFQPTALNRRGLFYVILSVGVRISKKWIRFFVASLLRMTEESGCHSERKRRISHYELRITNYALQITHYKSRITNHELLFLSFRISPRFWTLL